MQVTQREPLAALSHVTQSEGRVHTMPMSTHSALTSHSAPHPATRQTPANFSGCTQMPPLHPMVAPGASSNVFIFDYSLHLVYCS